MPLKQMYPGIVNSPVTGLAEAIDATQETILVIDASKLPAAPNLATLGTGENAETILYASKSGNYLESVTRGFQGTAANWAAGTQVARLFTAYDYDTARENIENLQQQLDSFEGMEIHGNEYHDPAFATEAALASHLADLAKYAKFTITANRSIPHATTSYLSFDQKQSFNDEDFCVLEDGEIQFTKTGIYEIYVQVVWAQNGNGSRRVGIPCFDRTIRNQCKGDTNLVVQLGVCSTVVVTSVGASFKPELHQNSGGALDIIASEDAFCFVRKVK